MNSPTFAPSARREQRAEHTLRRLSAAAAAGGRAERHPRTGSSDLWLVYSHADVARLLADRRLSSDSSLPGFPGASGAEPPERRPFARLDGVDHRRNRHAVLPSFRHSELERWRDRLSELVDDRVRHVLDSPQRYADLSHDLATPLMGSVIAELLGVSQPEAAVFSRIALELHQGQDPYDPGAAGRRARLFDELRALLAGVLDNRTFLPGRMLGSLCEQVERGRITRQDAENSAVLMVAAGHDTTAVGICLVVLSAVESGLLPRLAHRTPLVDSFVAESLRELSVIQTVASRVAVEDVAVGGDVIRSGDGVVLLTGVANHDPSVFPDPFTVVPSRPEIDEHLTFGRGAHACLGQALAGEVIALTLVRLATEAPCLRLSRPVTPEDYVPMAATTTIRALYVHW